MNQLDVSITHRFKVRWLQLLIAIDHLRQVSKVATAMNITQPAVSKAITEMERTLGLKLFERMARGLEPTPSGECLIRHARVILGELNQLRDDLNGLVSGDSGVLRVGTLHTTALDLLPRGLAALKARRPRLSITVQEGTYEALLPQLWAGDLDLIVGRVSGRRTADAVNEKILKDAGLSLVAGPHHVLAKRKRIRWIDVADFPWVLSPVNALLRGPLERAFVKHGVPMPVNRIETASVQVIRSYLQHSDALAVISEEVSKYYAALGLLAILPFELPRLLGPIGVVWSRHRPLLPAARELIDCLERAARSEKKSWSAATTTQTAARRPSARNNRCLR